MKDSARSWSSRRSRSHRTLTGFQRGALRQNADPRLPADQAPRLTEGGILIANRHRSLPERTDSRTTASVSSPNTTSNMNLV